MPTWDQTRIYIERTLEDFKQWHAEHNVKLEQFNARLAGMESEIKMLKLKVAAIGAVAGVLGSAALNRILQHFK